MIFELISTLLHRQCQLKCCCWTASPTYSVQAFDVRDMLLYHQLQFVGQLPRSSASSATRPSGERHVVMKVRTVFGFETSNYGVQYTKTMPNVVPIS